MDSSAAITNRTRSMPPTPASMFLMNLSWPGTSTKPRSTFCEMAKCAKPRSMEIPRCFSSFRRSVSMPVSAPTSAVLPWSMWPAVPIMIFFISTLFILTPLGAQSSETPTFKTGVADVRVDVLALQGQDLINSLTKGDFTVTDEGQPQSIIAFAHGDESLNLILLFDISGSMQSHIEQIAKTSAVHQDFSDNLAETARQISSAVHDHDVGVTTQINGAVVDAAHYMQAHADSTGRRAILILSDNLSTSFQLTDGQVIRELNKADTEIG